MYSFSRFCSPPLIRPVNEEQYHNTFLSEYWSCCWTCRRVFLLLINANQFRALMLNRDQYPGAADEICFRLGSLPAEVFNHKVNQDLGEKSDEIRQRLPDPSAAGPGEGNLCRISLLLPGEPRQLCPAVSHRKPKLLLTPRSEYMLELQLY